MQTKTDKQTTPKHKTLEELFNEPCSVLMNTAQMNGAFMVPGGAAESSLNPNRAGLRELKLAYHPGYGMIGFLKGKYFLAPMGTTLVAHE